MTTGDSRMPFGRWLLLWGMLAVTSAGSSEPTRLAIPAGHPFPSPEAVAGVIGRSSGRPFYGAVFSRTEGAAGILVTTTADKGAGSLRQAIADANAQPGADSIAFCLPKTDPGFDAAAGVWTIKPLTPLPYLTDDGLFIDGESQARFSGVYNPHGPEIQIDGALIPGQYSGLAIDASWCRLGRLAVNHFSGYGISVTATHIGNIIFRCYIGVTPDGSHTAPNRSGIYLFQASWNFVSWVDSTFANVIGGNDQAGIDVYGTGSQFNYIGPNFIGTDPSCTWDLGNGGDGIMLREGASDNTITDLADANHVVIWFNRGAGIHVVGDTCVRNFLGAGSITGNGGKAIFLEEGGNGALPPPEIDSATKDRITATTEPGRLVAFFQDPGTQAKRYLGFAYSDASGKAAYSGPVAGPHITALAMDTTSGPTRNNCSELSTALGWASVLVTTTADDGPGSLRKAIEYVNGLGLPDTILFAIPTSDPGFNQQIGTWTIKPSVRLPYLASQGIYIDGLSQREFIGGDTNPDGPEIELDGSLLGVDEAGLGVTAQAPGAEIVHLLITRFPYSGIEFDHVEHGSVMGCFIGTDAKGLKAAPNSQGIVVTRGSRYVYLGSGPGIPGNLISGNAGAGVMLRDSCSSIVLRENIIGLNRSAAKKLGNMYGILIGTGAAFNQIAQNRIGGNNVGIDITDAHDNAVTGNIIGSDSTGNIDLGNTLEGIRIQNSHDTKIKENMLAFNGGGITVYGGSSLYNLISRNRISHHKGWGIWNGNGGNGGLAAPTIHVLVGTGVQGEGGALDSIEVFEDSDNEGERFLGATKADTNGAWTLALPGSPTLGYLTATARDAKGNTSIFSAPFATGLVSVAQDKQPTIPNEFALFQNYPNPFNPSTVIRYGLPVTAAVSLELFNVLGERIAVLEEGVQRAGFHEIKISDQVRRCASGVYFYRLRAATEEGRRYERTMKMTVVR